MTSEDGRGGTRPDGLTRNLRGTRQGPERLAEDFSKKGLTSSHDFDKLLYMKNTKSFRTKSFRFDMLTVGDRYIANGITFQKVGAVRAQMVSGLDGQSLTSVSFNLTRSTVVEAILLEAK